MKQVSRILIAALVFFAMADSSFGADKRDDLEKITFYVGWYDVGQEALEGLEGVVAVTKGFRGFREINMVWFNPELIGPDDMIQALKNAGTYGGLAE